MKLAVFSDLHLDNNRSKHADYAPPVPDDVDVIVVAGDTAAPCAAAMKWAHQNYPRRPVVMVPGNHEHYGQVFEDSMQSAVDEAHLYPDVHLLENREVVLGGVRFLGCCLWTDFNLNGTQPASMGAAAMWMNDYHVVGSRYPDGRARFFTPSTTLALHEESRAWLEATLATPFAGPTVVVTHTGPHPLSVAEEYKGDRLTPSFVSDLSAVIEEHQPELWVHGHTHSSFDYVVPGTRTRVVCNPHGYVRSEFGRMRFAPENTAFDPEKVVEV